MRITIATFIFIFSVKLYAQAIHPSFEFNQVPKKVLDPIVAAHPDLFKEPPSPERMDKILDALYSSGEFESLKISSSNGKYTVRATPLKVIASVSAQGIKKLSENDVLTAFGVSQGEKFVFQNVYDGAERVKALYGKSGYFNTVVNVDTQPSSGNKIHLQLIIDEQTPCRIKTIDFKTNYEDLNKKVQHEVRSFINKPLTDDVIIDIESEVRDFFSDNKILSVSIQGPTFQYNKDKTEAHISYTLENAYKYLLFYEGNQFFSTTELSNKLALDKKVQFGSNPTAELANKIEKIYQSYGFAHVGVKYKESVQAQSYTRKAYFTITEGPRTYLRNISFNGKLSRPQKYYGDLFKQYYSEKTYQQDLVKDAQERIVIDLQNQGYLKAQILSSQTTFSDDKKRADLSFFVDEGPQTKINAIQFAGISAVSKSQLKTVINLKEDTPMNLAAVESSSQKILDYYHNQGYLEMELKSSTSELVKYSNDNTKADLYYNIYEGPQIKVARITVEGNDITKSYVVLNELEFDVGEILTPQKIADSEYHLQKTGLFTQVEITTLEKGSQSSERTIVIRVAERDPGLFNMGLGVNTEFEFTLRGYAGLSYNNIAGTARALSGRVELSRVADIDFIDYTITLGYLEPTIFAKRTRGRVNLIRAREIVSRTDGVEVLESTTLSFLLEKDFTRFFKATWTLWAISNSEKYYFPSRETIEKVNIGSIGPTLEYDRRDHPFVTHKGYYTKLSAEYADPNLASSQTVHYLRNLAQINTYVPLNYLRHTVWATSLAGGYLRNTKDEDNSSVPDAKIFSLGGRDTIRGFDPSEIPGETDKNAKEVKVTTESHYYLVKSEFRIPVYGQIESVLFYDGGAVFVRGNDFADPYRDSVGIGFRYQTPVGPLALEYGRRLDRNRDLDEPLGRFHLSFGTF